MKHNHTPGPWVFIGDPDGLKTASELIVHPDAEHSGGDSILYHGADWNIKPEDARLIVAAPDLLDALISAQKYVEAYDLIKGVHPSVRMKIKKAIEKATQ